MLANRMRLLFAARSRSLVGMIVALALAGISGTTRADLALTAEGIAEGFTLTTFATNFPNDGVNTTGPVGMAFPGNGVMVADWQGHVRVFPSHADGQDAGALSATAYGLATAVGLAQIGGKLYMSQNAMSRVVQVNPDGTFNQAIVDVFCATGLIADPLTGHLFVSGGCTGAGITDVDPVARTTNAFNSALSDGLALSSDGRTLYAAVNRERILGFDTTTMAQVFDSGTISFVDGIALGVGVLAGKIYGNTNLGEFWEVDLATSDQTLIASGGSRGDFVAVDPSDGTLLVTQTDRILRVGPRGRFGSVSQLLNVSTRLRVLTGDNVLIGGFIITGTDPKKVIVRGIGPSLSPAVSGVLADPVLELHEPDGTIVTNDNWKDSQEAEIIATGIPPTKDLESAIVETLAPGAYTAIVSGKNGGTGVGLVDAYDLDQAANSQLANISTRGFVDTGDNVMIGGFILGGGGGSSTVIVRGIGPSLANATPPVTDALADPTLDLHDSNGTIIASNDDWMNGPDKQTIIDDGLAPTNVKESALLATLAPGAYTAILSGVGNTTGVGLVEAYNLQ